VALFDLTEKAVLHAIAEFDALHREPFLKKYGFSKSSGYFLVYKGKSYDSKAIAGAAHGYIGGVFQPLRASKFSGGDKTVARCDRARARRDADGSAASFRRNAKAARSPSRADERHGTCEMTTVAHYLPDFGQADYYRVRSTP